MFMVTKSVSIQSLFIDVKLMQLLKLLCAVVGNRGNKDSGVYSTGGPGNKV